VTQKKWRLLLAGFCLAFLATAYLRTTAATMAQTANAFLSSLSTEERAQVQFKFTDEDERLFWHFIPTDDIPRRYNRPRRGLIIGKMNPAQRSLAMALLSAGLTQSGFIKVAQIMSLEDVLRVMEKDTAGRRDPQKYHFSVFGEPSESGAWSYRMEGHHVSLHFTVVKGKVAGSPTFLGANPHEVREGPRAGLRVLGREEDLARELLLSLTPEQRKVAVVTETAYKDILTEASRQAVLEGQPDGLHASKMNAKQRELLKNLLGEYVHNVPPEMAQSRLDKIQKAGNNIHFAWAGPGEKGAPHYYRIVSPSFLVEYDNTQNGANHSHTVWREFTGDFGLDLLKEHYQTSHTR